ncbi:hypothetical protein [Rhizobium sp. BK376]|uniref:hypothetical protein n=1 Tax=Rhizobium sp. BK376 TaxID=2512149 RepID=UPI0010473F1E|nr:hypothetical protein [Rhizobium sp. BK376]TCR85251.1 hypothetical protein EV561_10722 [Rhizobium sp. BK376]
MSFYKEMYAEIPLLPEDCSARHEPDFRLSYREVIEDFQAAFENEMPHWFKDLHESDQVLVEKMANRFRRLLVSFAAGVKTAPFCSKLDGRPSLREVRYWVSAATLLPWVNLARPILSGIKLPPTLRESGKMEAARDLYFFLRALSDDGAAW